MTLISLVQLKSASSFIILIMKPCSGTAADYSRVAFFGYLSILSVIPTTETGLNTGRILVIMSLIKMTSPLKKGPV
jgi:hypothetical protein